MVLGTERYIKLFRCPAGVRLAAAEPFAPPTSSTIHRLPAESAWIPSYPPRPRHPEMSSTDEGTSSVACHTPPAVPFSAVNSSRVAHGYQVEPSNTGSG